MYGRRTPYFNFPQRNDNVSAIAAHHLRDRKLPNQRRPHGRVLQQPRSNLMTRTPPQRTTVRACNAAATRQYDLNHNDTPSTRYHGRVLQQQHSKPITRIPPHQKATLVVPSSPPQTTTPTDHAAIHKDPNRISKPAHARETGGSLFRRRDRPMAASAAPREPRSPPIPIEKPRSHQPVPA